jgi:hypothetical protein
MGEGQEELVKDVTSTSFGLVIAFLLPGLIALYGLSYFSPDLQALFATFLKAESNVGLFLLITLSALALGLQVSVLRYYLIERWICRKWKLSPEQFASLGSSGKLSAFRASVDEHLRYHQFWGGMAVVMPLLFVQWLWRPPHFTGRWWLLLISAVLMEAVTVLAARQSFVSYVQRAEAILRVQSN